MNYAYDPAGRQTSTTAAGRALTYQYDPAGNRTRLTWPDGYTISTNYDALNRPLSYQENGTVPVTTLATYAWDDLSRRSTLTLGNGTASTNSYNAQGNLSNLTHNLTGTNNDLGFSYIRNQIGDITVTTPLNPQSNWALANPPETRTANGLNQYTTRNTTAITHDPNGNLQSDGIWTYGHDPDNRLVTAVRNNPASSASLGYDPAGRLARTVVDNQTTDLLYDGTDLIAEYDGAGNLATRHIHGPGIDEPLVSITGTSKTWRYADHLGSLIAEADATGNATAIRGYGPFGENGTTPPNRFGYTGQQYIAGLGLYYYKARWYSSTLGRFLETDPIGYADGVNWYAYVGNNPINRVDPDGKLAFFWHAGITYAAAHDSGMGFMDSLALAWNTMMVDKGTQSTAAADTNIYAMLGIKTNGDYQLVAEGRQAINGIIAIAPLPTVMHTTQDAATPDHYLKTWEGAGWNVDTVIHLVHDTFPSIDTIKNAYNNSMDVLSNRTTKK